MAEFKLGFIGAGKMAEAIASGVLAAGLYQPQQILLSDHKPARLDELHTRLGVACAQTNSEVFARCETVIIAVKPGALDGVDYPAGDNKPLIISIMAGVSLAALASKFGMCALVRVMPNTPAMLGCGMSAYCCNQLTDEKERQTVAAIFQAVGEAIEVKESQMDAVCGLSGSGPAYMYLIIEALADAGVLAGLARDTAYKLAAQTMKGAAEMVLVTGKHPGELKDAVTSPGGTTIAGVYALEQQGLRAALMSAVQAATAQSKKLGELK